MSELLSYIPPFYDYCDGVFVTVLNDVSVLVAVGVDGGAVAVAVLESGDGLARKLQTMDMRSAFAPVEVPGTAGLYWFVGHSAGNIDKESGALNETVCDGEFIPLADDASPLPDKCGNPAP